MKKIMIVALLTMIGIATTTTSFARGFRDNRNNNERGYNDYRNERNARVRSDHDFAGRNRFYHNDRRFDRNDRSFDGRFNRTVNYNSYYDNGCRR